MQRLSISLTDEQSERVDELVENGQYSSKNAVVQDWITRDEDINQLESEVNQLRTENERLKREKRQILDQSEEYGELVEYVNEERKLQRQREAREKAKFHAGPLTRLKWALTGPPEDIYENGTAPDETDTGEA